jgi:hypothetical protein
MFQKLDLFPSSGEGRGLVPSEGPNRVDVSLFSPEDGKRSNFRNLMFSSYLEFFTMDKVHKPSDSENKSRVPCFQPDFNVI